ncbi:MAG: hypothetical protein GF333_03370 [Candidatus Omnitrophica bacterium]|nr:hypothetical protein [Candidatus Omnitrophota bacterium]
MMPVTERIAAGLFLAAVLAVYALELRILAAQLFRRPLPSVFLRRARPWIHAAALAGLICFLYGLFVEPYWLQVNREKIRTGSLRDTSFRVVQISDLHCDRKIRNEPKLVRMVNELRPDIIVFTGDALNTEKALGTFRRTLASLRSSHGKFAVRGNFDVWYWDEAELFSGTGFRELNATVAVQKNGEVLYLTGSRCDRPSEILTRCAEVPRGIFHIVLFHYPYLVERLPARSTDLYLCGHTHGGQVAVPGYGALVTMSRLGKKYERGKYRVENTHMYVNRGVGMEGGIAPRVRFFARPEITVFDIVPVSAVNGNASGAGQ